jgi:hypothetical protein
MASPFASHRFSLRVFVAATILFGSVFGYGIRWWIAPYRSHTFYINGKVSAESWQRRTILGNTETLVDRPHARYYSNGSKSCEGMPGDADSFKYFGPNGERITHAQWWDYFVRDLGDGTFAESYPARDGGQRPLAKEFDFPPK